MCGSFSLNLLKQVVQGHGCNIVMCSVKELSDELVVGGVSKNVQLCTVLEEW